MLLTINNEILQSGSLHKSGPVLCKFISGINLHYEKRNKEK